MVLAVNHKHQHFTVLLFSLQLEGSNGTSSAGAVKLIMKLQSDPISTAVSVIFKLFARW